MSDGPPLSQEAPPAVDRGELPTYPLSPDFISRAEQMAAIMLQNLISTCGVDLSMEQAAEIAVRLAMNVANEVRRYRLVDNKVVRVADE